MVVRPGRKGPGHPLRSLCRLDSVFGGFGSVFGCIGCSSSCVFGGVHSGVGCSSGCIGRGSGAILGGFHRGVGAFFGGFHRGSSAFFGSVHGGSGTFFGGVHRGRSGRRYGHFFFLTASGQGDGGKQAGEQNGFFHDDSSNG